MWGVIIFRRAATTTLDDISLWLRECAPPTTTTHTHRVSPAPLASSWAWLWSDLISFRSACSLTAWTQRGSSINFLAVFFSIISCSRAAAGPFRTSVRLTVWPRFQSQLSRLQDERQEVYPTWSWGQPAVTSTQRNNGAFNHMIRLFQP